MEALGMKALSIQQPWAWAGGPFCWLLANPRPLPFTPIKGKLSLFEVDMEIKNGYPL